MLWLYKKDKQELKQTILAICQKYDIDIVWSVSDGRIMRIVGDGYAQIDLAVRQISQKESDIPVVFKNLELELNVWHGEGVPFYTEKAVFYAGGMLARAAAYVAHNDLQKLQRAFNIQSNEKNANVR